MAGNLGYLCHFISPLGVARHTMAWTRVVSAHSPPGAWVACSPPRSERAARTGAEDRADMLASDRAAHHGLDKECLLVLLPAFPANAGATNQRAPVAN